MTPRFRASTFRALAVLRLVLTGLPAWAQSAAASTPTASEAPDEARAHFDRGVTFYDETDYSAALVEFKRAYGLLPTWQVLFNIGQSYFQIRDYARALVTLTQFLDEGGERIPADRRALVDSERADLANRVGHVKIDSNRSGATVSVDDVAMAVTPLKDPLLVSVGVRKITIARSGSQPVEQEVSVSAGETVEIRGDFPEMTDLPEGARTADDARSKETGSLPEAASSPNRTPAWVAFGVATAGVAAGAVFGGLALHDKSRLDDECLGRACPFGSRADIDAVSRDGTVSTVAFGVAAAGVVTGVVLWLAARAPSDRGMGAHGASPSASVLWAPGFVAGRF